MKKRTPAEKQSCRFMVNFTKSEATLLRKACREFPKYTPSEIRRDVLLHWARTVAATEKPADLLK